MKIVFITLALLSSFQAFAADTSDLCNLPGNDVVNFSDSISERSTDTLNILTWNAHKYGDQKYFSDLTKLAADSDVIMLQEALHSSGWQSAFASHMPFSFSFFESFCDTNRQATGVQNGARYKLTHDTNLVSPDREPFAGTPKVTGISRIEIPGYGGVVIANIHAMNFNAGEKFERQIDQVVNYLANQNERIIWAGDFNTWSKSRQKYLDQRTKSLGLTHVAIANDNRSQVLDHIYVRGFAVIKAEVLNYTTSDHRPLKATLKFQ